MAAQKAIGILETKGLVAAIEGSDAALKAADVSHVATRKPGSGMVCVMFSGDVAAVKAAIDAAAEAAGRIGEVICVHVIARPVADVTVL